MSEADADMASQGSDPDDEGLSDSSYQDYSDEDINDYYNYGPDDMEQDDRGQIFDPEAFEYFLFNKEEACQFLDEKVAELIQTIQFPPQVSHTIGKVLLQAHQWVLTDVMERFREDSVQLMVDCRILPPQSREKQVEPPPAQCPVCLQAQEEKDLLSLACNHKFCTDCWQRYFQVQVEDGVATGVECMWSDCRLITTEDFALSILKNDPVTLRRYQQFAFNDYVKGHHQLRWCPGPDCDVMFMAPQPLGRKVECKKCKTCCCFRCLKDYHVPADCPTIESWLRKCADDSETANYISAHTKDCPKCNICIEKNGGCNHMQCFKCKHDFCWMCLGDWKTHGSEYYECSRYKENPNIANESAQAQAREALKKYLFYFERWENHQKSLKLEEQTFQRIQQRIKEKVMNNMGTWIDWQYLLDAANLLHKCRYTLEYTYPYAYYQEGGPRKKLFEYQQAQLEAEIENLSWKIERAEQTDRGDLENQMDITEKRRLTLLRDFQSES
ncbi:PREDICTED: E3 ubiquitin-protein ligase ARIH2-like isoform X1 [Branchiostoma belcheri]|uniref:RBR-type E3 ubiquitin transferase n=1 Tax=Branchiostoma belcheri TaxID=7741 RepID=A0A6P4ZUQ4_BRABE|nr:PREDICTED: E3 ubiquitin-protein ligase ARIH2-like isoform X1 [Branchiostoma belcheri]XP_019633326.1 PREDICTED: E3 ubiquitin-protein ligase ARIH2-like isoform X1 [Branchiostoma belcheri]